MTENTKQDTRQNAKQDTRQTIDRDTGQAHTDNDMQLGDPQHRQTPENAQTGSSASDNSASGNGASGSSKLRLLWPLFVIFFKAGTFTFAGGLAMLPVIEKDVVETHRMLSKDDFMEYATLSQTLPGVIAVNCASFVGRSAAGALGMLVASLGATMSAFVLMVAATIATQYIPQTGPAIGAMRCIRAASSALILSAAFTLGAHNLKSVFAVLVTLAAFAAVSFFGISTPMVVLGAGLIGYAYQRLASNEASKKEGVAP